MYNPVHQGIVYPINAFLDYSGGNLQGMSPNSFVPQMPVQPNYPNLFPNHAQQVGNMGQAPVVHIAPQVQNPPKPQLTAAIQKQTQELLSKAWDMSQSILSIHHPRPSPYNPQAAVVQASPQQKKSAVNNYHFDFSDKSVRLFSNQTQVVHHHHHGAQQANDKKDDTAQRVVVGLIGFVATIAAAFFLGKVVAESEDAQDEVTAYEDLKGQWQTNSKCYHENYQVHVDRVIKKIDAILARKATHRVHKFALLAFMAIAGGTAVAGAVVASDVLIKVAIGVGAVTTVAACFKLGYNYFSKREEKDAKAIEIELSNLAQIDPING